ncbi:major facilitator superfamily protein [Paraburkholderia hospita]|uniref:Major facilitator superfamily protein n=1 Tax=Paraburkholderia hospita TaxID=169430 RepID=A0ABN0F730_9BURK|nr:major facilitator superfamily protein [Paraburkholderia hospita]
MDATTLAFSSRAADPFQYASESATFHWLQSLQILAQPMIIMGILIGVTTGLPANGWSVCFTHVQHGQDIVWCCGNRPP